MSFNFINKSVFIDSFYFLYSSLDSLLKNLGKADFNYWSQGFDNVLDLVQKKWFYPCKYMSGFGKFQEKLPSKEKFYSSLTGKENNEK